MGIFNTRKNKRFGYTPRYYESDKEGSPFQIEQRFDKYRKTIGSQGGLKTRFVSAYDDLKNNSDAKTNKTILVIAILLLIVFLIIIDFDLSLFTKK